MTVEPDYFRATRVCDLDHPRIGLLSQQLVASCSTEREKAVAIFNFVREKILYRFDYPGTLASTTLVRRKGNCFNKANLQIALLRRAGIPAAYGVCLIHREVFQPLLPEDIYQLVSEPTVHVYACCYLKNSWVAADATIDRQTYENFYLNQPGWFYADWDGTTDYLLAEAHLVAKQGLYANIDLFLMQPPRFWTDQLLERANQHLEKLLQNP
ncbi:MAG TPA: transglutaminase-like domain-containing protein [bacterium]|nr:transglutaminase-like domain-containing protein [bacterium]HPP12395.1 transglutaminase-like domain-containing protein [bacterium]